MEQFKAIFKFEFLTIVKNKIYISITIILIVLLAGALSFNRISSMISNISEGDTDSTVSEIPDEPDISDDMETVAIKNDSSIDDKLLLEAFTEFFEGDQVVVTDKNITEIKESIENSEFSSVVYIKTKNSYDYIVNDVTIYDKTTDSIDRLLKKPVYIQYTCRERLD